MTPNSTRRLPKWLIFAVWGGNLILILVFFGLLAFNFYRQNTYALPQQVIGQNVDPAIVQATLTSLATIPATTAPQPVISQTTAATPSPMPSQSVAPPTNTPLPLPTYTLTALPTNTSTPPPFGETFVIGFSNENRPLEVTRFGNGPIQRMIIAGIHGGYEGNTIALAEEFLAYLPTHPEIIPPDTTLYILPNFNPDGYARKLGAQGRANANNVDLNRNWDSHWVSEWPMTGCWSQLEITAGSSPASEPEIQALMLFLLNNPIDALINYHSAALGIFPGGQPPETSSISLAETLAAITPYAYPPLETGCQYTGQLIDWAADHNIAAVDIELTDHTHTDFDINLKVLHAFLNWGK
jgi:hypothetical protein